MTDLFTFGNAVQPLGAEGRYGTAGDLKKTQYVMQLLGFPGDPDTLKCLITAAEKGIEIECSVLDISRGAEQSNDYLSISPNGVVPALKEAHYQVAGDLAIISFIEGRGLGNRLPPRNAKVLAEQDYWVDIARTVVGPQVQPILHERVLKGMADETALPDPLAVDAARASLAPALDAIDAKLATGHFIVGDYSFADIHWTAYLHLLVVVGDGDLVDDRGNLRDWYARIKQHKSFSGQNLVAFDLLPSLEDIRACRMKDVVITDF